MLNTQSKIVTAAQLQLQPDWVLLGGWFDPLTAGIARWIEGLRAMHQGRKLAAVVFDGPESLLPAQSRAIVVAALRTIDFVIVLPIEDWTSIPDRHDAPASQEFVDLVLRKIAPAPAL